MTSQSEEINFEGVSKMPEKSHGSETSTPHCPRLPVYMMLALMYIDNTPVVVNVESSQLFL